MRVGLIDPALRRAGHHVQFLAYLYALLRKAGFQVTVVDFAHVIRDQSDIPPEDIVNVADWLPTEAFPRSGRSYLTRMKDIYRKQRLYSSFNLRSIAVDSWVIATYDPYALPLLRYGGIDISRTVPIVHYMKFFRKTRLRPFGLTTYWGPLLLLKRFKQAGSALCLLHEQAKKLGELGYTGRCEYLSYNAVPENTLADDNWNRLSDTFRLCTVGIIRPDKDIGLVLRAVRGFSDVEYFIGGELGAGVEHSAYYAELRTLWSEVSGAIPRIGFLPLPEYRRQIELAHFSVIAIGEKYQKGTQQTGLLVDSLINRRPVIGPNVYPVNQWVRDYGVGLVYEPGSVESLAETIREARNKGAKSFHANILRFLKDNSFEKNAGMVKAMLLDATNRR